MDYSMLLLILTEAEDRVKDPSLPSDVRERSQETVGIVLEKLDAEGITRSELEALAK